MQKIKSQISHSLNFILIYLLAHYFCLLLFILSVVPKCFDKHKYNRRKNYVQCL